MSVGIIDAKIYVMQKNVFFFMLYHVFRSVTRKSFARSINQQRGFGEFRQSFDDHSDELCNVPDYRNIFNLLCVCVSYINSHPIVSSSSKTVVIEICFTP